MKYPGFVARFALSLVAGPIFAATPPTTAAKPEKDSGWVFSLLPKSLQKNPRLDLTVITEMTDEGKKLPAVSVSRPAYYEPFSAGYKALGETSANDRRVPEEQIQKLLVQSLASSGYHVAQAPDHPPSILLIYAWGTHNLLNETDADNPALSPMAVEHNLLDRAALVGGPKFAEKMRQLFEEADALGTANYTPPPDPTGLVPDRQPMLGAEQMAFMNPVERFKREAAKNEFLVDQSASDVYYVVASAYDYDAFKSKRRVLLWRTRMTVASQGVSQDQSVPTLVLAAGPYFGKEMAETAILSKRAVPDGTVEIGTPTVVEPGAEPARKK